MSKSSLGTNRTGDDDAPAEAHTWEELAEYERGEVILRLLRRITGTCLRNDRLRVLEREEWVCSGTSSDDALTCTQHLLLFGHVRHRHREALLALIRQMRLHAVRDLDTSVTIGLQPGDAVPYVLLEPLSPSPQTDGYIRWNRVYCAMRCGILQKLRAREEKIRHRLRELVQETDATSSKLPFAAAAAHSSLSAGEGGSVSTPAETLRFYTEEFGQLFTMDDPPGADGASGNGARSPVDANHKRAKQFLPVSEFMAATKASQVSLVQLAASVPTVLVAWSARYPECVAWLRRELFDDTHLKEIRSATGLSGRFAVLMDKDPWVSFAESHGGILPRLPTLRAGFRIELLQPLPKRAQIVLLNMDKDTEVARTTLEKLRRRLSGWVSPEVDLLSLWSGPKGLQSELATLFNVQTLPFVVLTRPGQLPPHATIGSKSSTPHTTANTDPARTSPVPVIVDVSCDPVQVSKRLYGVPDTPRSSGAAADNTWHRLAPAERARIVQRCGAYLVQQRLPLYFTATVTRDYVLRDSTATDPWQAVRDTASSHVCVLGEVITTHDIQPILAELRALAKLRDFEWGVRLIERSAPLLSSVDMTTPQRLLKGEMRCVTCSNCLTRLFVDTEAHVRCLCCSSTNSNDGAFCEKCAFTLRCHTPHHFLLRIPAGQWRPSLSLLWGPSNVVPLDLFMDHFVSNISDYHYGVYCDRCRGMIRGTRWKCAVCYQYDLCDACARARRAAVPAIANGDRGTEAPPAPSPVTERKIDGDAVPAQHDDATHPMIYIPFAQGSQHDKFLKQACVGSLQEWLDSVHR
ncbi:hypothetical protein ABB37_08669 [Leptomonas pyrrhocoris]|uniref:ZZ-type domain-containing protein n=1 Tax=Leptomonas pyrrhocoris TaxID=157538 RepID=A0A0M9FT15_LEPPY|nr:hypothetical protein ABB37_08669 [Leptomonas pyrrhocoris]KPA75397.1 hypothetical protein ABB37_08669 [Leptomonas pyrrhocoris]|eukprot:XP_015653836.1 hypothetical protein ABB37_08669 [Leptomonas pyrrhocoris]